MGEKGGASRPWMKKEEGKETKGKADVVAPSRGRYGFARTSYVAVVGRSGQRRVRKEDGGVLLVPRPRRTFLSSSVNIFEVSSSRGGEGKAWAGYLFGEPGGSEGAQRHEVRDPGRALERKNKRGTWARYWETEDAKKADPHFLAIPRREGLTHEQGVTEEP